MPETAPAPTPALERVEAWLLTVTTDPAGISAGIRQAAVLEVGVGDASELERLVTPGPRLSALERLSIYHDGYVARLVECLLDDYPALAHLLGAEEFERVARAYVALHPSRSSSLNAYGAGMPLFVRSRPEPWAPFARELAELEWALVEAIHAETRAPLSPDALASVPAEAWVRVRLVPSPALRVLSFEHPVNLFYQAFRDGAEPRMPGSECSSVAVHRDGIRLYRHELPPLGARLLAELAAGEPLGAAIERLERTLLPEELAVVQGRLSEWFGSWVSAGFFSTLELVEAP